MTELAVDNRNSLLARLLDQPVDIRSYRPAPGVTESEWVTANYEELLAAFEGKWIAVKGSTIIASAVDIKSLAKKIRAAGVTNPYVRRILKRTPGVRLHSNA